MSRWVLAFIAAFTMNWIWENAHSVLYTSYKGGRITQGLLTFMAFKDALVILILIALLLFIPSLTRYPWLLIIAGASFATAVELHAQATHRWSYTARMPLIPMLNTGLSPTIQMGLLAYLTYLLAFST